MIIPASLWNWNEDDYDLKELARDNAVGPGCLEQIGEEPPIISIARSSLAFGVFLPSYALEPVFYLLGVYSGSTRCSAIGKLAGYKPYFYV